MTRTIAEILERRLMHIDKKFLIFEGDEDFDFFSVHFEIEPEEAYGCTAFGIKKDPHAPSTRRHIIEKLDEARMNVKPGPGGSQSSPGSGGGRTPRRSPSRGRRTGRGS